MSKKLLIIDDDEDMLFLLKTKLQKEGFEVETSTDGSQALKKIHENKYNLIIVDIYIPKLSGIELCKMIGNKIPVLVISEDTSYETRLKIIGKYDGFVEKRNLMKDIVSGINKAMERWKMKRVLVYDL